MSKKCCGMIYSDDEKVCKICKKPLVDDNTGDSGDIETVQFGDKEMTETEAAKESEDDYEESGEAEEAKEEYEESDEAEEEYDNADVTGETEEAYDSGDADEDENKNVNYLKKHIEREAILDQIFDDNGYKKNDIIKEEREKVPYKGAGIFTLILAILGLVFIGLLVYFIVLNPYYIKNGEADKQLDYPELASTSDAGELSTLLVPYGATVTDAAEEN